MNEHRHKWSVLRAPDMLHCAGCNTVSDIETLLKNVTTLVARETRVKLLSEQLYARELKKDAHEAAYAWVRANASEALNKLTEQKQEALL